MITAPPRSVFVGVSGASGAPYALRLVQALTAAGCELQLYVSNNGVIVLQHELERRTSRVRPWVISADSGHPSPQSPWATPQQTPWNYSS